MSEVKSNRAWRLECEALRAEVERLRGVLRQCDEAMAWDLGGEPLPSLMIEARKAIKAALGTAVQPSAVQHCPECREPWIAGDEYCRQCGSRERPTDSPS